MLSLRRSSLNPEETHEAAGTIRDGQEQYRSANIAKVGSGSVWK